MAAFCARATDTHQALTFSLYYTGPRVIFQHKSYLKEKSDIHSFLELARSITVEGRPF